MVGEAPFTLHPPTMYIVFDWTVVPPAIVRPPDGPSMQLSFSPFAEPQSESTWTYPPLPAGTPVAGKMETPPDPPPPCSRPAEHCVGLSDTREAAPAAPVSLAATAALVTVIVGTPTTPAKKLWCGWVIVTWT